MAQDLFEDEVTHSGAEDEEEEEDGMEEDSDLAGFIVSDGSDADGSDAGEVEEAICRQQQQQQEEQQEQEEEQRGEDVGDLGGASRAATRQLPAASVHIRLVGRRVNFWVM